jgi:hypothetical protein
MTLDVYLCVCVCLCLCVYLCVYVCVCVCRLPLPQLLAAEQQAAAALGACTELCCSLLEFSPHTRGRCIR